MADLFQFTHKAVRARLIGDATLTALVPATKIIAQERSLPSVFPCITLAIDGSAGDEFDGALSGTLFVRVYTQDDQPVATLNTIYDRIKALLNRQEVNISDTDVAIGCMREFYHSVVVPETEVESGDTYSITVHYEYTVSAK